MSLEKFEQFRAFLVEYEERLEAIIKRINQSKKAILEKESSRVSIHSIITNLKSKLIEGEITALGFAAEMSNALESISKRFAWNPLIYEISSFINKLKTYQKNELIKSKDKDELKDKIEEWEKKVTDF